VVRLGGGPLIVLRAARVVAVVTAAAACDPVVAVAVATTAVVFFRTTPSKTGLPLTASLAAATDLGLFGPPTSASASRLRFCAAAASPFSLSFVDAAAVLAREAAVAPVARAPAVGCADDDEGGFARVAVRPGRALAFSLSFSALARVTRVVRRVCQLCEP
jgi:hypothetical protein